MCFSEVSSTPSAIRIPSTIDQQQRESEAMNLKNAFASFDPTPNCLEEIMPFLCIHVFGLCDTGRNLHTPFRGECLNLRDGVCSVGWARVMSLLPGSLPVCEDLPDMTRNCTGKKSTLFQLFSCIGVIPIQQWPNFHQ